ncbi:MAG: SDR family NAD(P)-dependent oxidoreductase [Candidatus Velthaea sp.]
MSALHGKTILITGANRGIGRALADRFADDGATCILTVRGGAAQTQLEGELAASAGRVSVERCDIAREADVAALRERVGAAFERVDVLVNNAGYFDDRDRAMYASNISLDVLRATFDVNLFGTVAMCTAFASLVPRDGRIINVSSTMGQLNPHGLPHYAVAYSVSKTAVNAYTTSLANELKERGIMVDSLHPGWVKTAMGGAGAKITPEQAADAVYFLATRPLGETGKFWLHDRIIDW